MQRMAKFSVSIFITVMSAGFVNAQTGTSGLPLQILPSINTFKNPVQKILLLSGKLLFPEIRKQKNQLFFGNFLLHQAKLMPYQSL
jgi:hypothetical protein